MRRLTAFLKPQRTTSALRVRFARWITSRNLSAVVQGPIRNVTSPHPVKVLVATASFSSALMATARSQSLGTFIDAPVNKRASQLTGASSGFFQNSCVTYSYVGGPYNGYHMYSCDAFSSQHDISMSVPLEADPEPPKSSITSATTRPRPTATQTTRTSTRAPATTQTTTKDSNISSSRVISTTMSAGSSTAVGLSTTAASSYSAPATGTEGAAVLTSTPSPAAATAPAAAADGSTVPQASNTGAIVGGVLGGLAAIALVVAVCLYFMWYRKKREEENTYLPAMGYTNDSAFYSQPPLGTSRQQAPAAGGARTSHGGYNSIRSSNDAARARGMGSAGYGVGAAAGIGAAAGASRHQQQRSFSLRHDPGSAAYGKTMDDTAISPVDPTDRSISPPDSPNPSPARPVSPPQAYNRFNPPPPEHFRAYKPYEGT